MAVLQKANTIYPFWGESVKLITGLDPLGMQVTSEATFSVLLPGISNLTNRIRYFGFYCWLLDAYVKSETRVSQYDQYRFIRRAELAIALIMQTAHPDVTQITGSDFAASWVYERRFRIYDLKVGADLDGKDERTYWKNPSGAFGQLYFGAMQALALVTRYENEEGDVIFNLTPPDARQRVSGQQLADAINEQLPVKTKETFLKSVRSGKLMADDIPALARHFSINKVNPNSSEWELYTRMLMDKDYPAREDEAAFTFHRRDTIAALLKHAASNDKAYNWRSYIEKCYDDKFVLTDITNTGWYCYQLNEYWQFSCGVIFCSALLYLESLHTDVYFPKFVKDFTEKIIKSYKYNSEARVKDHLEKVEYHAGAIDGLFEQLDESSTKYEKSAKVAFDLLFCLYKQNKDHLQLVRDLMESKMMLRDGNVVEGLAGFADIEEYTLEEFIESFLLRNILRRHQMVALRKMGNGRQLSAKFAIEEQKMRLIDIFPARWTSPRMNALRNLLSDLQVVDEEMNLTPFFTKIIGS